MRLNLVLLIAASALFVFFGLRLAGIDPIEAASQLAQGAIGSSRSWAGSLRETTPLLLAGLAVFIALQAGLFNIGVEGQFLVGACAATAFVLAMPSWIGVILGVATAAVAGGVWAYPAALIKVKRNGHEVISTIMLNNLALLLTGALVKGPLQSRETQSPTTATIAKDVRIPNLVEWDALRVSWALAVALLAIGLYWNWYRKSVAGYELRATGANRTAAEFAGVRTNAVMFRAMILSGAVAGLAGALQVLAYEGRFYPNFSPGYGFDGLGVALLAGASPLGLIPAALGFGMLAQGSTALALMGIPRGVTSALYGILIVIFAAYRYKEVRRGD